MKSWNDILGQDNALRCLKSAVRAGRMPRCYLFWGREGVGRALAARVMICELFSRGAPEGRQRVWDRISSGMHPDVIWIRPEAGQAIKIGSDPEDEGTVRWVINKLNLRPYQAPFSVAVIEDAHAMTLGAANALLKTLEEPPGDSMIILITDRKELLPRTVLSRLTQVRFSGLPENLTRDIIARSLEGLSDDELRFLARSSQGSPGRAIRYHEQNVWSRLDRSLRSLVEAARSRDASFFVWDEENRVALSEDLELLMILLRDSVVSSEGLDGLVMSSVKEGTDVNDVFSGLSARQAFRKIACLIDARTALNANCNVKLLAQLLPSELLGE